MADNVDQRTTVCETNKESIETKFVLTVPPAPTQTALNAQLGPPKGYELFPGVGHYKFHIEPLTWPLALQSCAEEGAHLAIINSEKESDVMKTLFGRYPTIQGVGNNFWAWIGLHRIGDSYITIFGVAVEKTGFQRWYAGDPTKGNQYCGVIGRAAGDLADLPCEMKQAFFCEFDLQ